LGYRQLGWEAISNWAARHPEKAHRSRSKAGAAAAANSAAAVAAAMEAQLGGADGQGAIDAMAPSMLDAVYEAALSLLSGAQKKRPGGGASSVADDAVRHAVAAVRKWIDLLAAGSVVQPGEEQWQLGIVDSDRQRQRGLEYTPELALSFLHGTCSC
jgi:hypothetical protein